MARSSAATRPLVNLFEANACPENAVPMRRYMREQFDFLGIKTPVRIRLVRDYLSKYADAATKDLSGLALDLWALPYREYQYAALDVLDRHQKRLEAEDIPMLERLITNKSWWDTVDALAARIAGSLLRRNPGVVEPAVSRWRNSDNLWLRRTAILFQLKYKHTTDEELLFEIIRENAGSSEFFLQKAIGWALREYSKTNPRGVQEFVRRESLAALSRREALKWVRSHPSDDTDESQHESAREIIP